MWPRTGITSRLPARSCCATSVARTEPATTSRAAPSTSVHVRIAFSLSCRGGILLSDDLSRQLRIHRRRAALDRLQRQLEALREVFEERVGSGQIVRYDAGGPVHFLDDGARIGRDLLIEREAVLGAPDHRLAE